MTAAAPHRRADIQGLRALAVAGVVAAHVFGWPANGYLGVDVFFVISGFVITGVLLRDRQRRGRVSFRAFYARRARRILPLALVVIALTVIASAWALSGPRADEVRVDALWSAAFLANWHFAAVGSDYFALGDAPSPLLHYWSLGVEEQFYLVWPWLVAAILAVAAGRRFGRALLGGVCIAVVGASVAWAVVQVDSDAITAYYSSLTRAWELAIGAALACVPAAAVRLGATARAMLSWLGLAVVVASFVLLSDQSVPVPAAIAPTVGVLLVLVAGIGEPVRGAVFLTNPVSRYLGDISYGLYLWHFPLLVLLAAVVPVSAVTQTVVVVLTLVLATVSYFLLERPILDAPTARTGSWRAWWVARRRGMIAAGTAAVCLVAAGIGVANAGPGAFDTLTEQPAAAPAQTPAAPDVAPPAPVPTSEATAPTPTPTTTTNAAIPLGPTGEALRAGLAKALAAKSFPADITPKPDQWATTADQSAAMKPCVATVASNPSSCTFGNPNGPEIDIVGDSLGIPLLAAVVAAYGKDYKIRGLTKIACAVNGVDANYGKDEWAVPCVNHRRMVIDYVAKAKPAAVLVIETYAWATRLKSKATGDALADEWIRADEAFTQALRQGTDHVVFVSASLPGVAFLDCYRAGGSPSRCVTGIPTFWQQTHDAERRVKGATFIDTLHWYCVDGRCPIFTSVRDTVLKGDYLHPSVQYMRLVADDLRYRLSAAGVLP